MNRLLGPFLKTARRHALRFRLTCGGRRRRCWLLGFGRGGRLGGFVLLLTHSSPSLLYLPSFASRRTGLEVPVAWTWGLELSSLRLLTEPSLVLPSCESAVADFC